MADGITRCFSTALSRLRERGLWLPLPQAGEGWGEGIFRIMLALFVALFSVAATAGELPDPTRPPASIAAPVAAAGSGAIENQPVGLQSVIISKTRRAAIIDGETVELGGKHGDAKLTEVNEGSVVLRGVQGRQVMTLFPDVKMTSKKEVKSQSPAGKAQSGKQKTMPDRRKEEK